ncbi:hypothetical protein ACF1BK_06200 [Streptomyces globisporus]|uniref:hypothetical protein n=1 Tax=Streptomyces globisporus TaxID=1908 RepID=UPI00370015B4
MPDIIVALIAAGATIGAAAIGFAGIQRSRSRNVEEPVESLTSGESSNTPRQVEATPNQSQASTSGGITINANDARQVIGRNDGNVTQVNHYGSKRDR